jgi:hypothetical protein
MDAYDRTAVLKQRCDWLHSELSELEKLRSRVITAEDMQERRSVDHKPGAAIRQAAKPK